MKFRLSHVAFLALPLACTAANRALWESNLRSTTAPITTATVNPTDGGAANPPK